MKTKKEQGNNIFIQAAFDFSTLSATTKQTYSQWIRALCRFTGHQHPFDISVKEIQNFYLYYHDEKQYSRPSLEIIRAAIKYFFCVLCQHEDTPDIFHCDKSLAEGIKKLFAGRRSYAHKLPEIMNGEEIEKFLEGLPDTNTGRLIKKVYETGKPVSELLNGWQISSKYVQVVAAQTSRKIGVGPGFGLRGVRATGIVARIRNAKNDYEINKICQDTGLSWQQFKKYIALAGQKSFG